MVLLIRLTSLSRAQYLDEATPSKINKTEGAACKKARREVCATPMVVKPKRQRRSIGQVLSESVFKNMLRYQNEHLRYCETRKYIKVRDHLHLHDFFPIAFLKLPFFNVLAWKILRPLSLQYRRVLVDWLAELGSRFQLEQSTVHVAVSMIIRSCGSVFLVDCLFVDWLVGWLVGWFVGLF